MPRICEICRRKEEVEDEQWEYDILDVCKDCANDRKMTLDPEEL